MDADDIRQALDGVVASDLEARTIRAIDKYITVLDGDQAPYEVYSESGRQYPVDVAGDECSVPTTSSVGQDQAIWSIVRRPRGSGICIRGRGGVG